MYRYGDFTHEVCFTPSLLGQLMSLSRFQNVECRETGPVLFGHGSSSMVRALGWQVFRLAFTAWNLIELGHAGSRIFTRAFLICGARAQ